MARGILKRLLYGGNRKLRPYERACFMAVGEALSPLSRDVLERQLAAVENIQRHATMSVFHLGVVEEAMLFADASRELRIARMRLRTPEGTTAAATLVADGGRISSLHFAPSLGRAVSDVVIERLEILRDPASAAEASPPRTPTGMIEVGEHRFEAQNIEPPRGVNERQRHIASLGTVTPADYAVLLAATNGFTIGDWQYHGTAIRLLPIGPSYIVAAERADSTQALCFEEASELGRVLLVDEINAEVCGEYSSFLTALHSVATS
jgi:hypothetical protein